MKVVQYGGETGFVPSPNEVEILIDLIDDKMKTSIAQSNPTYINRLNMMITSLRTFMER